MTLAARPNNTLRSFINGTTKQFRALKSQEVGNEAITNDDGPRPSKSNIILPPPFI